MAAKVAGSIAAAQNAPVQTTFLPLPNHFFHSAAHSALLGGKPSLRCQVKQETNRSSKPAVPLRSSHLAAALA
jgi:hypothetical protein